MEILVWQKGGHDEISSESHSDGRSHHRQLERWKFFGRASVEFMYLRSAQPAAWLAILGYCDEGKRNDPR
jgi:hypothetical protein